MMTNIEAGMAVVVSPSHGNDSNRSSPIPVSRPLSSPLDGSYICAQMRPMMMAGTVYGKNEITR